MKKLINAVDTTVDDFVRGLCSVHGDVVTWDPTQRILHRTVPSATPKVGLVSGGGSGCEPTHAGFVGPGMLDAAAPGAIFTSPVPAQIAAATRFADQGRGVVHVVKNFTGEVMNFGMAEEILHFEDIETRRVLVADDVSIPDDGETAGRRGLGATVLVEKIAGAMAETGADLDAVADVADRVSLGSRTLSVGLSSCTPPSRGRPVYDLGAEEMDLGIGISGEPGRERLPLQPARALARRLAAEVLADLRPAVGTDVLVLVNGMGATPFHELYTMAGELVDAVESAGVRVARQVAGSFVTALDQTGVALTVLALDPDLADLWDAPVHTPGLRRGR